MNSLDSDMQGVDQETLPATESELRLAFAVRLALNDGDPSKTLDQIAEIIFPYGISLADVQEGLPQHTLRD